MLIFIACFIPGNEVPNLHVPFADKWVHFILFGGFTFLWLLAYPRSSWRHLSLIGILGAALGWLVEELQGQLSFLGRAKDLYDIYADACGALIGVLLFAIAARMAGSRQ
ncbi:MAG: VanZ family protein [Chitinophagaceae bacterium]|nr:VanZ family protein [Chitinophagaceae bacterium]